MTKRLVDLDDDLRAKAKQALGTAGNAETVRRALREANDSCAAARR